jgi:hypothetical protein
MAQTSPSVSALVLTYRLGTQQATIPVGSSHRRVRAAGADRPATQAVPRPTSAFYKMLYLLTTAAAFFMLEIDGDRG